MENKIIVITTTDKIVDIKINNLVPDGLNIDTSALDMSTLQKNVNAALLKPVGQ